MEFAYEVYTEKVYHLIIDAKYFHVTKKSLLWISAAQFIVFREKRKMIWREILREKWATKKFTKNCGKKREKIT